MITDLKVSSWVAIRRGCPISYRVHADDDIDILCGSTRDGFEFTVDAETLREFVRVGTSALGELEEMRKKEAG
jgi:hypothetical protein